MPTLSSLGVRLSRPRIDERLQLMVYGLIVGSCSGLAAVALNRGIEASYELLLGLRHLWWAFVIPGVGAGLASFFLRYVTKERVGHGVPEVIFAVSIRGGSLKLRSSISRLVSSCLTIGSGGSAGPEGPAVMSGASLGSNIAKLMSLNERQRIALVGCGAGGAIAAIFNAPTAGIFFSMEVILGEWSRINLASIAIAAVAGAEVSRLLQGNQIPFGPAAFSIDTADIGAAFGLAVAAAAASILLTRLLRSSHHFWDRVPGPTWVRAFVGGCLVGAVGLGLPLVLGEGYATVRTAIEGGLSFPFLLLGFAALAKIVATSLTIGSGGSGGIFAPSLVIGSLVGLSYSRALVAVWPSVAWVSDGAWALFGMAGLISGMLQAPLTGIFLIVELTGGWSVILPLIVVSVVSATICHQLEPASFYLRDLIRRGQLLRPGTDARVLADLTVNELLELDCVPVSERMRLGELVPILETSHRNYFPVEDDRGRFVGLLHLDDLRPYLFNRQLYDVVLIGELMDPDPPLVSPHDELAAVLERMERLGAFSLPVVEDGRFVGMISKATLLDQYRKELAVQTERI